MTQHKPLHPSTLYPNHNVSTTIALGSTKVHLGGVRQNGSITNANFFRYVNECVTRRGGNHFDRHRCTNSDKY